jgi:hypothetical protein
MRVLHNVFVGALVLVATSALASTTCSSVYDSLASNIASNATPPAGYSSWLAHDSAKYPQCFSASTAAAQAQMSGTSLQQVGVTSSVISARLNGGPAGGASKSASLPQSGMAAGSTPEKWNAWVSAAQNDTRQNYTQGTNAISSSTDIRNVVIGGDYMVTSAVAWGASLAIDSGDNSGTTNGGAALTSDSQGYSLAPYVGWQINQDWTLDASAGLGRGKLTATNSETKSRRLFVGGNLNFNRWAGDWQYTGKLGLMHAEEKSDDIRNAGAAIANTATTNKMNRLQAGAQIGYWTSGGAMPYAAVTLLSDSRSTTNNGGASDPIGKTAAQWALGVNFFSLNSGVTGGVSYMAESSRSNQKNNALMGNLNFRF